MTPSIFAAANSLNADNFASVINAQQPNDGMAYHDA